MHRDSMTKSLKALEVNCNEVKENISSNGEMGEGGGALCHLPKQKANSRDRWERRGRNI